MQLLVLALALVCFCSGLGPDESAPASCLGKTGLFNHSLLPLLDKIGTDFVDEDPYVSDKYASRKHCDMLVSKGIRKIGLLGDSFGRFLAMSMMAHLNGDKPDFCDPPQKDRLSMVPLNFTEPEIELCYGESKYYDRCIPLRANSTCSIKFSPNHHMLPFKPMAAEVCEGRVKVTSIEIWNDEHWYRGHQKEKYLSIASHWISQEKPDVVIGHYMRSIDFFRYSSALWANHSSSFEFGKNPKLSGKWMKEEKEKHLTEEEKKKKKKREKEKRQKNANISYRLRKLTESTVESAEKERNDNAKKYKDPITPIFEQLNSLNISYIWLGLPRRDKSKVPSQYFSSQNDVAMKFSNELVSNITARHCGVFISTFDLTNNTIYTNDTMDGTHFGYQTNARKSLSILEVMKKLL